MACTPRYRSAIEVKVDNCSQNPKFASLSTIGLFIENIVGRRGSEDVIYVVNSIKLSTHYTRMDSIVYYSLVSHGEVSPLVTRFVGCTELWTFQPLGEITFDWKLALGRVRFGKRLAPHRQGQGSGEDDGNVITKVLNQMCSVNDHQTLQYQLRTFECMEVVYICDPGIFESYSRSRTLDSVLVWRAPCPGQRISDGMTITEYSSRDNMYENTTMKEIIVRSTRCIAPLNFGVENDERRQSPITRRRYTKLLQYCQNAGNEECKDKTLRFIICRRSNLGVKRRSLNADSGPPSALTSTGRSLNSIPRVIFKFYYRILLQVRGFSCSCSR
ncbi:hypothetical protein BC629DRAFT_1447413 [Irpex lacteus]|nr:hypothetical protein BC629DRAFT_1447413 [Irpex lacteus]